MRLSSGTRIGPYEIVASLGAGGMGEVYRARDTRLNREVAVKVQPISLHADPALRARFEREAQALAALNHPHIAAIYDVIDVSDHRAIVMELVPGSTLAERMASGPVLLRDAIRYGIHISDALSVAHAAGIVHRDLKPLYVDRAVVRRSTRGRSSGCVGSLVRPLGFEPVAGDERPGAQFVWRPVERYRKRLFSRVSVHGQG